MKRLKVVVVALATTLLLVVSTATADELHQETEVPETVSVVLLGRKGSGITSTVRQILGPNTTIHAAEEAVASTDILEYTLRIPPTASDPPHSHHTYLKLVDVPGLELGDNLEHDAEILSTLKSYLHDTGLPTFFLVVYRIDDKGISDPGSKFSQLLKSVEILQRCLFQVATDNTLFLLTRLLNEDASVQVAPAGRVAEFQGVIRGHTSLPQGVEVLVGDNKPDLTKISVENGYYKLPNGELYPKNVLDKLVQVAGTAVKGQVRSVVDYLVRSREIVPLHTKEVVAHASDEETFESDLEAFEYLLRQDNIELPSDEVQGYLQSYYDKQEPSTQISSSVQLRALQVSLRNLRIGTIDQLPSTITGMVKLFQEDVDGVMTSKYSLYYLKHAFNLDVPEYPWEAMVVGNGYDLFRDRVLKKSPFLKNASKRPSSSLGYQFPDYVECERLGDVEEVVLANISGSLGEYKAERLKLLGLGDDKSVLLDKLLWKPKDYFNLGYAETGRLTGVREVRLLECKMTVENETVAITEESFIKLVNSLPKFNSSDGASVAEWKLLLHSYGTHVITKSYGGGWIEGLLEVDPVPGDVEEAGRVLREMVEFDNLNSESAGRSVRQVYAFHALEGIEGVDPRVGRIVEVGSAERERIMSGWKQGLNLKFEMLVNELELVRMSQVVGVVNRERERDCEEAMRLLMEGKLEGAGGGHRGSVSVGEKRRRVTAQAEALKVLNKDKALGKLRSFDEFLERVESG